MKNLSIKILVLLVGLAGGVSAAGASDLPDCVGDDYSTWNNCFGTRTFDYGHKYAGEWKYGKWNGLYVVTPLQTTLVIHKREMTKFP